MTSVTISVDAMGGDHGPKVVIPAAIQACQRFPELKLILVGPREVLEPRLARHRYTGNQITLHHCTQTVAMDEPPAQALRYKKDSSMRVAINLVKEGKAQACVSAGNTGALMATARFVLKTLPGVDRPAIIAQFPTEIGDKNVYVLDLGANVDSKPENLLQFAVMGSVLVHYVHRVQHPSIGLLNIGSEEIKGNDLVKATSVLLESHPELNYTGFVEGDDIYSGAADVIVCDGFVGNVALKASEGLVRMLMTVGKRTFKKNVLTMIVGAAVKLMLAPALRRFDPGRYNGACLLGLNGIVIKATVLLVLELLLMPSKTRCATLNAVFRIGSALKSVNISARFSENHEIFQNFSDRLLSARTCHDERGDLSTCRYQRRLDRRTYRYSRASDCGRA